MNGDAHRSEYFSSWCCWVARLFFRRIVFLVLEIVLRLEVYRQLCEIQIRNEKGICITSAISMSVEFAVLQLQTVPSPLLVSALPSSYGAVAGATTSSGAERRPKESEVRTLLYDYDSGLKARALLELNIARKYFRDSKHCPNMSGSEGRTISSRAISACRTGLPPSRRG